MIYCFPRKSTTDAYCTSSRQYLSMLWLRIYMIELFTRSVFLELVHVSPHRILVDRMHHCNTGVVLLSTHRIITEPCCIIVPFDGKSLQKRWRTHIFWSTPHNDNLYHYEYRDIIYSEIESICNTQEGEET